ncbi:MAG: GH92 family glycosyl hydrolase [Bacteroidota bacterium]
MTPNRTSTALAFLLLCLTMMGCAVNNPRKFVNPFIGTDGTGHTFPGPCMPFGLVQPGPDNADIGWNHSSGYQYRDTLILGFSQTRCNGTGINEFGDVLIKPLTHDSQFLAGIPYWKKSEKAEVGLYQVRLKNNVHAALTCSNRVGFHQYTFPESEAKILVDLQHGLRFLTDSLVMESDYQLLDSQTLQGFCHTRNWVDRKYFFVIQFETPFYHYHQLPRKAKDNAARIQFNFRLNHEKILRVKIALSSVSTQGAMKNLEQEIPHWQFRKAVKANQKHWDHWLNRIEIQGNHTQKTIFYTALYRLFIQPNNIADVDSNYRGANDSIYHAKTGKYFTTLSLWDTYRATHPLYTLIAPEMVNDFVNSMVEHGKIAGFLPIWSAWGQDNYCMIGNHAVPVIADAFAKGFKGYDTLAALRLMVKSLTENHINSDWTLLNKKGYYPYDRLENEAVSRTLEHGVDDYCLGTTLKQMGDVAGSDHFLNRANNYHNLFDASTYQFRGKNSEGRWRYPFNPLEATSPMNNPGDYTEANAWQYFWTPAQYDVQGLSTLLGGPEGLARKLDTFFALKTHSNNKFLGQEAMIGQYAHGNEPSHHVAYLYRYTNHPEKSEPLITQIVDDFYKNRPDGLIGNDDCGQMSAWYIFSTLGFYPVNPSSGTYTLGKAQCRKAVVHLDGGKQLVISNKTIPRRNSVPEFQPTLGASSSATWNGNPVKQYEITHKSLIQGGILAF